MREIKFRVWDIKRKIWRAKDARNRTSGLITAKVNDGIFIVGYSSQSGFVTQQFTGLKDKNNKEIYEGDIVKYSYCTHEHEFEEGVGEVFFENGIFFFDRKQEFATNDANFLWDGCLEVIGNVFENGELIK